MSDPAPHTPPRGPLIILGTLAAFASFAVIGAILQILAGGKPADAQSAVRLKNKADIAEAQSALLKKSGLADNADAVISKAVMQIAARKLETSKVVIPGSPTAIKLSAPAPAPANPAKPVAAPVPAPVPPPAAPAPPPAASVPLTPAPVPVPVAPPAVPPVPGKGSN